MCASVFVWSPGLVSFDRQPMILERGRGSQRTCGCRDNSCWDTAKRQELLLELQGLASVFVDTVLFVYVCYATGVRGEWLRLKLRAKWGADFSPPLFCSDHMGNYSETDVNAPNKGGRESSWFVASIKKKTNKHHSIWGSYCWVCWCSTGVCSARDSGKVTYITQQEVILFLSTNPTSYWIDYSCEKLLSGSITTG